MTDDRRLAADDVGRGTGLDLTSGGNSGYRSFLLKCGALDGEERRGVGRAAEDDEVAVSRYEVRGEDDFDRVGPSVELYSS